MVVILIKLEQRSKLLIQPTLIHSHFSVEGSDWHVQHQRLVNMLQN